MKHPLDRSGGPILAALLLASLLPVRAAPAAWDGFQPFSVREPSIPAHSFPITDFGAVSGGKELCTDALARAVAAAAAQGGGRVVIPAGLWLTGPIVLRSNVELHTEQGALVQFAKDTALFQGRALIFGEDLENIAITGGGIFDGAGEAWRPVKHSKMTEAAWKALLASGGVYDREADLWSPRADATFRRPNLLVLSRCRRVLLDGTTFENSPAWNINPSFCDDVTIRNLTITNPWYAQNGDGLDIDSCQNVVVRGNRLDVGDDGLCLKSGARPQPGQRARRPQAPLRATANVLIEDCVVYHAHGGFTIGSEMSGGVRNVKVDRCTFVGTDVGLRFKTLRGRGGVVENIYVSRITMTGIATDAISFNMYYGGAAPTEEPAAPATPAAMPVGPGTPQFRNLYLENIVCRGAQRAVQLQGLPEMPIRGIHLRNVSISADTGLVCEDASDLTLEGVDLAPRRGPVATFRTSREVVVDRLTYGAGAGPVFRVEGTGNAGLRVSRTATTRGRPSLDLAGGADASAVALP